jgi:hypothetical protein
MQPFRVPRQRALYFLCVLQHRMSPVGRTKRSVSIITGPYLIPYSAEFEPGPPNQVGRHDASRHRKCAFRLRIYCDPGLAQMSGNSCSQLNGKWVAFCKGNPDRTRCMPDCNQAMAECMTSGIGIRRRPICRASRRNRDAQVAIAHLLCFPEVPGAGVIACRHPGLEYL